MSAALDRPACPYAGLTPYSEKDADFFFGRDSEREIISANLRASRLTLFYGPSGVGKSSVLQAVVVHHLRQLAQQNMEDYGRAEFVVVVFKSWAADPIVELAKKVREAVALSLQIEPEALEGVPVSRDLSSILEAWTKRFGMELLIILDQFEEYFVYHETEDGEGTFAVEFPKVVNRTDLAVRFLVSMREDMLSKLDRFKGSIPNLFNNRLQIAHLTVQTAREAITGPINIYNTLIEPNETPYEIESTLTSEVLKHVKTGQANLAEGWQGNDDSHSYVETPYLQLVMTRIWNEETQTGSRVLREETLTKKLGGAKKIIETHLDSVMKTLLPAEQDVAADCFNYLATPIGTKIAVTPSLLAEWTEMEEEKIAAVMEKLVKGDQDEADKEVGAASKSNGSPGKKAAGPAAAARGETRILRPVEIKVGDAKQQGYEVSHDALIPAIRDWRSRYLAVREQLLARRRARFIVLWIFLGIVLLAGGAIWYGIRQRNQALDKAINSDKKAEMAKELVNKAYKTLDKQSTHSDTILIALGNLSSDDPRKIKEAVEVLEDLDKEGAIPKEVKPAILVLAGQKKDSPDMRHLENALKQTPASAPNHDQSSLNDLPPRVYIQIQDEQQRASAKDIQARLEAEGFVVPGIDNVGRLNLRNTQVRFFHDNSAERDLSQQVAGILQRAGVNNSAAMHVEGFDNSAIRPKHLELWFSADAFARLPAAPTQ
jgi:hypothetical protein